MSRVLFLSRWFPFPPSNGSKLRIYNLIRALGSAHELTLISFNDQPDVVADKAGLQAFCQAVHIVPWHEYNPESNKARKGFLSSTPRSIVDTYSPEMRQLIETCLAEGSFDVVLASQIDMAAYSPYFGQAPALFEEAEVGSLYEQYVQAGSLKERARYGLTWSKHRHYLKGLMRNFKACTVVSAPEKGLLATAVSPKIPIEIIPNCVDLNNYADVQETAVPNTLIFTGAFTYEPNYEAMVWFLEEVFPLVRAEIREAQLTITGKHAGKPLPSLENVTLTGFVDDIRPLVARSWVSIVPIWTGGGTRLKILEAMALHTPVVATSKGAEGLGAVVGEDLFVADTAVEFANILITLLKDEACRQMVAQNAYEFVGQAFNWPIVAPRFLELVERIRTI